MNVGIEATLNGNSVKINLFGQTESSSRLLSHCKLETIEVAILGHLYYRRELARYFGECPLALGKQSPAECVAHLVQRYGLSVLDKLEGEFSLVLARRNAEGLSLIAARDPNGAFPLFCKNSANGWQLSSSLDRLVGNSASPILNPAYLAEFLLTPGSLSEMDSSCCVWQDTERIRPGDVIHFTAGSLAPQRRMLRSDYWTGLSCDTSVRDEREWAERYRSTLSSAVAERISGQRCAVHLSGGLDSTTVAYLVGDQSLDGKIPAISLMFAELGSMSRETPYIHAALEHAPRLKSVPVMGDDTTDFEKMGQPDIRTEEPYTGVWRAGLDQLTIDAAASHECNVLLTGIGGDETLDRCPYHIADQLRKLRPIRAWQLACEWAKVYKWNPWNVFYPFGLANIAPVASRIGLARYLHMPVGGLASANEWELPGWLGPEIGERLQLKPQVKSILTRELLNDPIMAVSVAQCAVRRRAGNALGWALGTNRNLSISHPMLDPRVVSVAIGWHKATTPRPGKLKPLLLEAFRDALPPAIANRRTKSGWNEPFYTGLRKNLGKLKRLIIETEAPLGTIDQPQLLRDLEKASLGLIAPRKLQILLNYLGLVHWSAVRSAGVCPA